MCVVACHGMCVKARGQLPRIGPFHFSFPWALGLKPGSRLEPSTFLAVANLHGKVIMAYTSLTSKSAIQRASKSVAL